MRLRHTPDGVIAFDALRDRWVSLPAVVDAGGPDVADLSETVQDVLSVLAAGRPAWARLETLMAELSDQKALAADPEAAGLPFAARSMRAFMVYESHAIASARVLVRRFFPRPAAVAVATFERVTGKTFPALKPSKGFYEAPPMYVGNHTAMLGDHEEMWWPSHTEYLDFELELACVLGAPLSDATPEEARAAIGGWFVLNDWSARDVQAKDYRENVFGPVVKSKTFANSMGADVITADELPDWRTARGRVLVDGDVWCEGSTEGAHWDIGDMLAYASQGELLDVGDVFSTGTMPGCCGLELDRWILPGQTIELQIDGIGSVTNAVASSATPLALAR
ncbi:MAG: fumarylacetoacetate hydrolase family protein [Solirubrobacteraceae bacterium]|nr:fumarylacetoacetate hydrolase family protein [Solirubrobacteraceae bacterium]